MLMGRTSYQAFTPVWPDMEDFADYKVMPYDGGAPGPGADPVSDGGVAS
jgi:hypothetical protein